MHQIHDVESQIVALAVIIAVPGEMLDDLRELKRAFRQLLVLNNTLKSVRERQALQDVSATQSRDALFRELSDW